jgi:hypothetical protein
VDRAGNQCPAVVHVFRDVAGNTDYPGGIACEPGVAPAVHYEFIEKVIGYQGDLVRVARVKKVSTVVLQDP